MTVVRGPIECRRELVKVDLVRVRLSRVRPGMTHERLQRDEVASTLADEAIREAVSKLVGGKGTNTCPTADAIDHPPKRLLTRRLLRILPLPLAPVLRDPLLDLDDEDAIIELRRDLTEKHAKFKQDIWVDRHPLPVMPLPANTSSAAEKVDITPAAGENLRPPQPHALHQQDRWLLVRESSGTESHELLETRTVDVGLPLRRSADLARRIALDHVL